ncbi:MAG: AvaI/BsoBI family type II restriction endonuclease [Nitrososphaerales archaeon]
MPRRFREHLSSFEDLTTSYAAVRAGFVALALEKNRRATPFVEEARALKAAASRAKVPNELLKMSEIRSGLVAAAGISDKALGHLEEQDRTEAIVGLIKKFLEPAGNNFVEELVFRFLLTRGDTLGGSMRNFGGALAERKFTRSLISYLRLAGRSYWWQRARDEAWVASPTFDADIEFYVKGLSWVSEKGPRTLLYNLGVPIVGKNVDFCLFSKAHSEIAKKDYKEPANYLALGELKGGIDPAGADEHWKTAATALERIREAFAGHNPAIFFVGAAVATAMAKEIWRLLEKGTVDNAANLTDDNQLAAVARWLCSL